VSKKDLAALIGKSIEAIRHVKKTENLGIQFGKSIEAIRLREKNGKLYEGYSALDRQEFVDLTFFPTYSPK